MNSTKTRTSRTRRLFQILLWSGTVLALFYVIENWRGARAWTTMRAQLEAKGEILDWQTYWPRSVPDEQNFFGDKTVRDFFAGKTSGDQTVLGLPAPSFPVFSMAELANWDAFPWGLDKGQFVPRKKPLEFKENSATATPAVEFLKWFQAAEPALSKLHALAKKPSADLNMKYAEPFSDIDVGRFVRVRTVSQLLATHARACLVAGRPGEALEDLRVITKFIQAEEGEPYLVAAMIRVALIGLMNEVIVDGVRDHAWKREQLAEFIPIIEATKVLPAVVRAMRGERAGLVHVIERSSFGSVFEARVGRSLLRTGWIRFCPRGWANQYLAGLADGYDRLLGAFDARSETIGEMPVFKPRNWPPYPWQAAKSLPNLVKALETAARNQTFFRETQIACALELCRLEKGAYPQSLAQLIPAYLSAIPWDAAKPEPLRYLRKENGYVIYSTGLDRKDDGGDAKKDWVLEILH